MSISAITNYKLFIFHFSKCSSPVTLLIVSSFQYFSYLQFVFNYIINVYYIITFLLFSAFMEDTPSVGIFTYRLKGFSSVPTDHYMRPFFVDAEPDFKRHKPYCIGLSLIHI